ncbi:MAG: threonine synthase [Clostridia bacterium]|nr:threonine synthase [Clostridia bacterium]
MNYRSTRDFGSLPHTVSAAEAIKEGLAPDGGLYIPCEIPALTADDLTALAAMSYEDRAAYILAKFLDDYDREGLVSDCHAAYSKEKFAEVSGENYLSGGAAPLYNLDDSTYVLELWHGPTSAFKDMALQIMPRLLSRALKMTGETRTAHILVATSGDTGKAALEGYADVDGVKITVFYPVDGVSRMQKLQMTTTLGGNVYVAAVNGNFDDAQNGVKAIFGDASLADKANDSGFFFSSANSINWGRLAPQIVYYVSAYLDLVNSGKIKSGEPVNVCVPTGNFGNIFAAYIAREMGIPLAKLICASNSNNVLTDFLNTGVYDRTREFHKTISPSMDILISSNLERLLSVCGGAELTGELMAELKSTGKYTAPDALMAAIRETFAGYCMSEDETRETIREIFDAHHYLIDTHTAVGMGCVKKYRAETGDNTPVILASTASPYKFAADVCGALGLETGDDIEGILNTLSANTDTAIPSPLTAPLSLPVRFTETIDPSEMPALVFRV